MTQKTLPLIITLIITALYSSFSMAMTSDDIYNDSVREMKNYCASIEAEYENGFIYPEKYLCNCETPVGTRAKYAITGRFTRCEKITTIKNLRGDEVSVRNWVRIYFIEDNRCVSYAINPLNGDNLTNTDPSAGCYKN